MDLLLTGSDFEPENSARAFAFTPTYEGISKKRRRVPLLPRAHFHTSTYLTIENCRSAPTNPDGWRTDSWQPSHVMADHENVVTSVAVCPLAMEAFASGSLDHTIKLWSLSATDQTSGCVSTLHGSLFV